MLAGILKTFFLKRKLKKCGGSVVISKGFNAIGVKNISLGSNIYIGPRTTFLALKAGISIGDHVMLGPEVMIITGDHRFDVEGVYMDSITDNMKLPDNDKAVVIEEDCWIGARAIILKGITIHKGSVVAAGAIVLKDVPEYSIYYNKNDIRPRFKNV